MSDQDETTRLQAIRERARQDNTSAVITKDDARFLLSILEAARQEIATLTELAYHRQSGGRTWKDVATVALHDQASAEAQGDALRQQIATLQAQVDALTRAQAEWQPIDTAPEAEWVSVYLPGLYPVTAIRTSSRGEVAWFLAATGDGHGVRLNPSHWKPLAAGPGEKPAERATVDALTAALRALEADTREREKVCRDYAAEHGREKQEASARYHEGGATAFHDIAAKLAVLLDERGSR